jgi:anti-sigma factor RsiW
MSFHPRRRRPDDWTTSHARARADLSDRMDGVLDPSEAGWLDEHLAGCAECRAAAAEYEAERVALRSLRDLKPAPPRDLWARTAAAIEHESRFRERTAVERARRPLLGTTVLAAALVVVVAAGVLTSSRLFVDGDHATPSSGSNVAAASASAASDTALIPISQKVTYIGRTADGRFAVKTFEVRDVCP